MHVKLGEDIVAVAGPADHHLAGGPVPIAGPCKLHGNGALLVVVPEPLAVCDFGDNCEVERLIRLVVEAARDAGGRPAVLAVPIRG